jgi:hypothetical protein
MKKLNVGISISATAGGNIWSSGINQNIGFLGELLQKSPIIDKLWFLNGGDTEKLSTEMDFDRLGIPLVRPEEVTHEIDVMIEMGAILPIGWMRRIHARGAKIVCFGVGHNYNAVVEALVFNKGEGISVADPSLRVETWGIPQHTKTCSPLMKTLTRKPMVEMPHLWSPYFLDKTIRETEANGNRFGFQADHHSREVKGWQVAIFEPNIAVVKNAWIPMLVCEQAYRLNPEAVSLMKVMNSFHMKEHATFLRFALNLDLTKHSKASYEPRVPFAHLMGEHQMDAVVSHHWECGLNYAYYDALYGGYPLIHNSEFLLEHGVGIYYPKFSALKGGDALLEAWKQPPEYWQDYKKQADEFLKTLHPEHPENIRIFTERLLHVYNAK